MSTSEQFDPNIHAELVYDGGDKVHAPERLGNPKPDQLQGTPLEQLAELAGRVCYDSLGAEKARGSVAYHAHIREVGHLSVYEHCVFTVEVATPRATWPDPLTYELLEVLVNRPGVFVRILPASVRVTCNLRSVLEFFNGTATSPVTPAVLTNGDRLVRASCALAPVVLSHRDPVHPSWSVVAPERDEEKWITLLMCGSRGMSHELVRHGDFTAISQRSTRFLDEDATPWVEHPLLTTFQRGLPSEVRLDLIGGLPLVEAARDVYRGVVRVLAVKHPRKQVRGVARGFLGNALYTEVIFSASVAQWRYMLRMRCSDAADAEIRVLFSKALRELQRSNHGDRFADLGLRPATDGIGEVLI